MISRIQLLGCERLDFDWTTMVHDSVQFGFDQSTIYSFSDLRGGREARCKYPLQILILGGRFRTPSLEPVKQSLSKRELAVCISFHCGRCLCFLSRYATRRVSCFKSCQVFLQFQVLRSCRRYADVCNLHNNYLHMS